MDWTYHHCWTIIFYSTWNTFDITAFPIVSWYKSHNITLQYLLPLLCDIKKRWSCISQLQKVTRALQISKITLVVMLKAGTCTSYLPSVCWTGAKCQSQNKSGEKKNKNFQFVASFGFLLFLRTNGFFLRTHSKEDGIFQSSIFSFLVWIKRDIATCDA